MRKQNKERRALVEDGRFFDPCSVIESQLGAVQEPGRMQAGNVVRERNPRRSLDSKNGIVFNSDPRSGIQPVPKIAFELTDVAEIVAVRRSLASRETGEAAFLLITEREKPRKMPVELVVGLAVDKVPV